MTEAFVARRLSRVVTVLASISLVLAIGESLAHAQTPVPRAQMTIGQATQAPLTSAAPNAASPASAQPAAQPVAADTIPPDTTITMQNWQQFQQYMPDGMVALFQGKYFWKMPPDVKMEVGPTIIRPLPKTYMEATEKYSGQVKLVDLPDGALTLTGYQATAARSTAPGASPARRRRSSTGSLRLTPTPTRRPITMARERSFPANT
jgi:hypothetical protein